MRWALLAVATALAAIGLSAAEMDCYSNGGSSNLLDSFGQGGVIKCKSSSDECSETMAEPPGSADGRIRFSASCSACPKWSFKSDCRTCKAPLCNTKFISTITSNNLLCYLAEDSKSIGEKRIWCSKATKSCFYSQYVNKYNEIIYNAGCGKGWSGCTTCDTSLCNVPDEHRSTAKPASGVSYGTADGASVAKAARGSNDIVLKSIAKPSNSSDHSTPKEVQDEAGVKEKGSKASRSGDFDYDNSAVIAAPLAAAVTAAAASALSLLLRS